MSPRENTSPNEGLLRVIKTLSEDPELTQREISKRAGISLGKVNFLLKALIDKGLVKTHNFKNSQNKKAYLYILTPSGIEAKTRMMYSFLARKIEDYEALEKQIQALKKEVAEG